MSAPTLIRLERPYFTPSDPQDYETVIPLVAGTGVSGALAVAAAFAAHKGAERSEEHVESVSPLDNDPVRQPAGIPPVAKAPNWQRCVVVWSIRAGDYIELPFPPLSVEDGLEMRPYLTGQGRPRLDMEGVIKGLRDGSRRLRWRKSRRRSAVSGEERAAARKCVWAYISGPNAFIAAAEAACKAQGVDYYGARWDI